MFKTRRLRELNMVHKTLLARVYKDLHIDPLEVFFLPDLDLVVPIISKNACFAVKESLIRYYVPEFSAGFPEIHRISAESITHGKTQRLFFSRASQYQSFIRHKNLRITLREPLGRLLAAYNDHVSGKNHSYGFNKFEQRLRALEPRDITLETYAHIVCSIPPNLADRHFKPQAVFAPNSPTCNVRYLRLVNLQEDWNQDSLLSRIPEPRVRNKTRDTNKKELDTTEIAPVHAKWYKPDYQLWNIQTAQRD